jgi:WD40 repeat protein
MPRAPFTAFLLLLLSAIPTQAFSQASSVACGAPPAVLTSTRPNIFSEQQEQWLGDAMADQLETYYKPVKDPAANAYLDRIATRLLAALPPTTIKFRVILVESSEINGFSLAGGRVYITRKLVANAHSEDEVAAVIAHEFGHILSHQFAQEITADLQHLLGVTTVTDRADIYAKFQQLTDARMKRHSSSTVDTDEKQDEADRVSVYATAAAGYRPQAYSEFWDRSSATNGKVGNKFSDFFGITSSNSKRLRAILNLVAALPPGCGGTTSSASTEFTRWQQRVIANQAATASLSTPPLSEVQLAPPLRMSLQRLRFSRDGKNILAQDESSVFVLSHDPFKLLFRFDAEDSLPAQFSPDSQHIVFHTPLLHTEEWSIPEQKLVAAHEPVARHNCLQSELSPDGRTLFCVSWSDVGYSLDLSLLEAETGQVILLKKGFVQPSAYFIVLLAMNHSPRDFLPLSYSADGNTLLIGPSFDKLAFDLRTRTPIKFAGNLKEDIDGTYAFLGNDRIAAVNAHNPPNGGIFSFPDGRQLKKIKIPFNTIESVSMSNGDNVIANATGEYAAAVADLSTGKYFGVHNPAVDLWDGQFITEGNDGAVLLTRLADSAPSARATLPLSPLGRLNSVTLSPSGRFIAISNRTRGGIWNVDTGKQVGLMPNFDDAVFHDDEALYVQFPKQGEHERAIYHISTSTHAGQPVGYKEDEHTRMLGGNLLELKQKDKSTAEFVAHNVTDNSILWSRIMDRDTPAYTTNFGGPELIFSWLLKSPGGKAELKAQPALAAQAAAIKDKDSARLIEIVDNLTGKLLGEAVVEVPQEYIGVGGVNRVADLLYVTSDDNRTMVYSLDTAKQLRQIFGQVVAADPASKRICTANRRDEIVVYDSEGIELAHFTLGSPIRFARFRQNGTRLILMTADQKIRTMEIRPPTTK